MLNANLFKMFSLLFKRKILLTNLLIFPSINDESSAFATIDTDENSKDPNKRNMKVVNLLTNLPIGKKSLLSFIIIYLALKTKNYQYFISKDPAQ